MNFTDAVARCDNRFVVESCLPSIGGDTIARTILSGLSASPPRISSMFFYDAAGSKLFEEITRLPEYYPARTEKMLLAQAADSLGRELRDIDIVEIGSGDCSKISIILNAIPARNLTEIKYVPVDISQSAIEESAATLVSRFPGLRIHGVVADFLTQLDRIPKGHKRLFCFLGGTLGNLDHADARLFFDILRSCMQPHDLLLLGVDMVKPADILEAAYNDSSGVTAAFNRNILNVVNKLTGCNFDPLAFEHIAFFNGAFSRIEMHLRALRDMVISSARHSHKSALTKGEMIHTENSYKFTRESLEELLLPAGLRITRTMTDDNGWFSLFSIRKASAWD